MLELELDFLGAPLILRQGQPAATDRRKAVALLAYLAETEKAHSREALAALFWPDYEPERAFAYLRRALWEVNQLVGAGRLKADRDSIQFERQAGVEVDLHTFEQLLGAAGGNPQPVDRLEKAVALVRGDFLAEFNLRDSPEFDQWQENRSEYYRRRFSAALEQLTRAYLQLRQAELAIQSAQRLVNLDALNEAAQRLLMEIYAGAGQRSAALRQYETCRQVLHAELGAKPEPQTTALYEKIRAGELPPAGLAPEGGRAENAAAQPAAGYLPVPASPFIGRRAELAEISYLLEKPDCRMVTIYGPGGMGKTRLALQTARAAAVRFPDGAFFVSLASVSDTAQITFEIAQVLKIRLNEGNRQVDVLRQLADYLRGRRVLLVLDNYEHLVSGASLLSDLLSEAPEVRLLVTSRERLNLPEEWAFELSGLSFPLGDEPVSPEDYSSVQLFTTQAQRVQTRFQPSEAERAAIARICRMVAGMPLGIELAAAWVRVLSCQEIAAELSASLDFLKSTQRGLPERHRSLRAVFEHSWKLLSGAEQQAFRRLAVFQGGFTKQAAAQVAGVGLAALTSLVDKALVTRDPAGRYALHAVLHQYAAEKLGAGPGEQEEQRESHRRYYLGVLLDADHELAGAGQKQALELLAPETANMRAAWYRTVAQGSLDELETVALPLLVYYQLRSLYQEGWETFSPALDRLRRERSIDAQDMQIQSLYVLLLAIVANFQNSQGLVEGREATIQGLELAAALPAGLAKSYALTLLGYGFGNYPDETVDAWHAESLQTLTRLGDAIGAALALHTYGSFQHGQSATKAAKAFEAALEAFTRLGNRWGMALCTQSLANVAFWVGSYSEASRLAQGALEIYSDLGDPWRRMEMNLLLGQYYTAQGSYPEARLCFQEALVFARHMGNRFYIGTNLDCLAYIETLEGHADRAEEISREALATYRQVNHIYGVGMALTNLGDARLVRRDLPAARAYYLEALTILSEENVSWGQAKCLKKMGTIDLLENQLPAAEEKLRQALALSMAVDRFSDALEILELLAEFYTLRGEAQHALSLLICLRDNPALTADIRRRCESLEASLVEQVGQAEVTRLSQPGCNQTLEEWIAAEQPPAV